MSLTLLGIDVLGATPAPAELAKLDRKLTLEEQAVVEKWQEEQANVMLAKERQSIYVDPKTGEKRTATVTYEAGAGTKKPPGVLLDPYSGSPKRASLPRATWSPWYAAIAVGVVAAGGWLIYQSRAPAPRMGVA